MMSSCWFPHTSPSSQRFPGCQTGRMMACPAFSPRIHGPASRCVVGVYLFAAFTPFVALPTEPEVPCPTATPRSLHLQTGLVLCCLQVFRTDSRGHVPLNVPVPFETENFVGEMVNCLRGYPGTPPEEFKGGKLLGRCIIQVSGMGYGASNKPPEPSALS